MASETPKFERNHRYSLIFAVLLLQLSSSFLESLQVTTGMKYKLSVNLFHFVRFLLPRPTEMAWQILTIHTSNDAVSLKEVPFGVLTIPKTSKGFISPQTPKGWPGIQISSLNEIMNSFSTNHAIFAQISSIGAAWLRKLKNINAVTENSF
jgi:hypothetical protein